MLRRELHRLRRAGIQPTSRQLARLLSLMPGADLYLATACDLSLPGAWECFEHHCLSRLRPILLLDLRQ